MSTDKIEPAIEVADLAANTLESGSMSTVFTFFSNLGHLAKYLDIITKYFFPALFAFKAIKAGAHLARLAFAKNKNARLAFNAAYDIPTAALAGLVIFGAAIVGAAGSFIFAGLCALDVFLSLGQAIFYHTRAVTDGKNDAIIRNFYKTKRNEALIRFGVSLLITTALVFTMILAPYVTPFLVMGLCVTAAAVLIGLAGFGLISKIKASFNKENTMTQQKNGKQLINSMNQKLRTSTSIEFGDKAKEHIKKGEELAENMQYTPPTLHKNSSENSQNSIFLKNYFTNQITLEKLKEGKTDLNVKRLKKDISDKIEVLKTEICKAHGNETSFFSQIQNKLSRTEDEKRLQKINLLLLLQARLIGKTEYTPYQSIQEVKENTKPTKIELLSNEYTETMAAFKKYCHRNFPKAFQSFKKEVGDVELYFKQACHALETNMLGSRTSGNGIKHGDTQYDLMGKIHKMT